MEIRVIKEALDAAVIAGEDKLDTEVDHIYASDLMSDVLAFGRPNSILFTGLATQQAIISAYMAEFKGVVFVRGKSPRDGANKLAEKNGLVLLLTDLDMYDACLRAGHAGSGKLLEPDADRVVQKTGEMILAHEFFVRGGDFANAGMVSTEVKSVLRVIGLDPKIVRKIAISTYEAEMNVVMHADRGQVTLSVTPRLIEVIIADQGKGIADVGLAMQEGYTTATEEMRAMGFGSGMGLANMKKNSDELNIESEVGNGTTVKMKFFV